MVQRGAVPYKDVFDHKGPITYFVFAFCNLFPDPYLAAWFVELICFSICAYILTQIAMRYLKNKPLSITCALVTICILLVAPHYGAGGGAVEEYFLPVIAYFIKFILDMFDGKKLNKKQSVLIGCLLAVIFWTKFTIILMPALFMVAWLVFTLIKKEYKYALNSILFMLIGFAVITVPVLFYFLVTGAIKDLFYYYFYCNLFLYGATKTSPFLINIKTHIFGNYRYYCLALVGILALFSKDKWKSLIIPAVLIINILVLSRFTAIRYYYFTTLIYVVFAIIFVASLLKNVEQFKSYLIVFVTIPIAIFCCYNYGNNIGSIAQKPSTIPQNLVAQEIKNSGIENPTLFCYKMTDNGFYNVSKIAPVTFFYAQSNFSKSTFPEMFDSFDYYIENQVTDFVVVLNTIYEKDNDFLDQYYDVYKSYNKYTLLIKAK